MSSSQIGALDSKGRLIIPAGFRDLLNLAPGREVLMTLDEGKVQLIVTPTSEKQLILLKIELSDAPGSLAKAALILAEEGVDLVSTQSHSISRGKAAEWRVICSSNSVKKLPLIKQKLFRAGAKGFSATKL